MFTPWFKIYVHLFGFCWAYFCNGFFLGICSCFFLPQISTLVTGRREEHMGCFPTGTLFYTFWILLYSFLICSVLSSSSVPNSGHWSERGAYGMFPHWDSLIASLIHWEHNFTNQFPSTFDQNRMDMYINLYSLQREFDLQLNVIILTYMWYVLLKE